MAFTEERAMGKTVKWSQLGAGNLRARATPAPASSCAKCQDSGIKKPREAGSIFCSCEVGQKKREEAQLAAIAV